MAVRNFIQVTDGGGGDIATSQPTTPGFWDNSGTLTYWDGTQNRVLDFSEGEIQGLDGTPIGDQ